MQKISVTIITFNEEKKIRQCINSVKTFADEIIVVDSNSTDSTESICKELGVNFIKQNWLGYSEQKNFANKLANNDWIFSIDADEMVSEKLSNSILKLKNEDTDIDTIFTMNRLTNYCGKWMYHCGMYPDRKTRLWNRTIGKWEGFIHETLKFSCKTKNVLLNGDLLHYSFDTTEDFERQIFKFAEMRGQYYHEKGHKNAFLLSVLSPFHIFFRNYILKLGFLDGKTGWYICMTTAKATNFKYKVLKNLNKSKEKLT